MGSIVCIVSIVSKKTRMTVSFIVNVVSGVRMACIGTIVSTVCIVITSWNSINKKKNKKGAIAIIFSIFLGI